MTTACRDCDDRSNAVGICAAHRVARHIQDEDYWVSDAFAYDLARRATDALIAIVARPWWDSHCPDCGAFFTEDRHAPDCILPPALVALGVA